MRNLNFLGNVIDDIFNNIKEVDKDLTENSKIQIYANGNEIIKNNMHTKPFKISDYENGKNRMIEYFEHILQSDEKFTGYGTRIDVTIFDRKEGGSRNKAFSQDDIKAKKGIITINNNDNLCKLEP